jgi:hypothetical protein
MVDVAQLVECWFVAPKEWDRNPPFTHSSYIGKCYLTYYKQKVGGLTQSVECFFYMEKVGGSSPSFTTINAMAVQLERHDGL